MKAIFLDRDGTIIVDKNYLATPEEVEFLPDSLEFLKKTKAAGYTHFIVTNQSGVGRGYFPESSVHQVHSYIQDIICSKLGFGFEAFEFCPHVPSDLCECRKPKTKMFSDILKRFPNIERNKSFMIGDKVSDVHAGDDFGIKSILLGEDSNWNGLRCSSILETLKYIR